MKTEKEFYLNELERITNRLNKERLRILWRFAKGLDNEAGA